MKQSQERVSDLLCQREELIFDSYLLSSKQEKKRIKILIKDIEVELDELGFSFETTEK